jgi:hypothetical protein
VSNDGGGELVFRKTLRFASRNDTDESFLRKVRLNRVKYLTGIRKFVLMLDRRETVSPLHDIDFLKPRPLGPKRRRRRKTKLFKIRIG